MAEEEAKVSSQSARMALPVWYSLCDRSSLAPCKQPARGMGAVGGD